MGTLWIEDGQQLLFIGDSITDCGRRGADAPLGSGYVRIFTELAAARWPERRIKFTNKGIGGHKITDLRDRWRDDVLYHRPQVLSLKIGINDLHSHLRGAEGGVSPELFARTYAEVLELTRKELDCKIVLLTPFYISTDRSGQTFRSQVLDLLPRYLETVEKMSAQFDTRLVRLHEIFQAQLRYRDAETFCPEPVHPNHAGHVVIAQALLETLSD